MRLSSLRKKRGLTQEQLARLVGVSQPLIARLETGQQKFYPRVRRRLATIFDVEELELKEN